MALPGYVTQSLKKKSRLPDYVTQSLNASMSEPAMMPRQNPVPEPAMMSSHAPRKAMGPPVSTLHPDGRPMMAQPSQAPPPDRMPESPLPEISKGLTSMIINVAHPGARETIKDASLLNLGNEVESGIKAVVNAGIQAAQSGDFKDFGTNIADSYRKNVDQSDELKKDYRLQYPKSSLAATIGPNLASGAALTKAMNPQSWKSLIGYGMGEGAMAAWGDAPRGDKTQAAGTGATVGGLATAVLPPAIKAVGQIPKLGRGLGELLTGVKKTPTAKAIKKGADDAFTSIYTRTGGTAEEAKRLSKQDYLDGETVADVIPEQSLPAILGLASKSDDIANKIRKGPYAARAESDKVIERSSTSFKAGDDAIATSNKYRSMLKAARQSVGGEMDVRIRELHGVSIKNSGELEEFIGLKKIKPLLKEVEAELEADGLKLQYRKTPGKTDSKGIFVGGADDPNAPILDEAFVDQLGKAIQKKITEAEEVGVGAASWMKQKRNLRNIAKGSSGDPEMSAIRNRYSTTVDREQAFHSGRTFKDEFGTPLNIESLPGTLASLDKAGKVLFRRGALTHYAKKGDKILDALGSPTERKMIGQIFGEGKAGAAKDIAEREETFDAVSKIVMKGASNQGRQVMKDVMAGHNDGIKTLFASLEGKRAYSLIGAVGLGINEVLGVLQKTDLPDEAVNLLWKKFSASGPEINRILKQLPKNISNMAKEKALKVEMKSLVTSLKGATGAAAGGLVPRLTTGYFDGYGR